MSLSATLHSPIHRSRTRVGSRYRTTRGPIGRQVESTARTRWELPGKRDDFHRLSDEDLLSRYRDARRPEDFTELYRRYSAELGRYLGRYLGDRAMAEDVLQDAFLQVHAKCGLYQDGWAAKPWLYAVAMHRAVDALRRARRLPAIRIDRPHSEDEDVETVALVDLLSSTEPGPLQKMQEQERRGWVRESVARLPEPLRQVLALAYDKDLSYAEIAGLLEIPLGTVKSRLHNAIARLRAMAERYEGAGN